MNNPFKTAGFFGTAILCFAFMLPASPGAWAGDKQEHEGQADDAAGEKKEPKAKDGKEGATPLKLLGVEGLGFELGGYLLGLHGFQTHTIARRLDNRFLDRWVNEFRGATGQFMLDKTGTSGAIDDVLGRGGTLVLLGDQYAGDRACWTEFFGRPASTHKAVALFTLSASAPTATCAVLRRGSPLHFEMAVANLIDPLAADAGDGQAAAPLTVEGSASE